MAADDKIITIRFELDPGSAGADIEKVAKQVAETFKKAFSSQADPFKIFDSDKLASNIQNALSKVDLSKADFGRGIRESFQRAGPLRFEPSPEFEKNVRASRADFIKAAQPLVSGLEAFNMLMRGERLTAVAQMAGEAFTGAAELAAQRRRTPDELLPLLAAGQLRGSDRRAAERAAIERRLAAIPGAAAAEAGAAEGGGISALVGGGMAGAALRLLGPAAAGAGIAVAAYKIAESFKAMADAGAAASTKLSTMSTIMGVTDEKLLHMAAGAARAGVPFDGFRILFERAAISAQQHMPEIAKQVETAEDRIEESHIKVREADRGVAKAVDDREAAVLRLTKAEAELVKEQETGADVREQQMRAATLAVSGAMISQRGAQMGLAQAQLGAQFAGREAGIQDIQGPLSLRGARLGLEGAEIAADEARYRGAALQGQRFRNQAEADLATRKAAHEIDVAEYNVSQQRLRIEQAALEEDKRAAAKRMGLGPEAQAQQQLLQAAQASEMAQLRVDETKTARRRLEIDQAYITEADKLNELLRARSQAERDLATAYEPTAQLAARAARVEEKERPYLEPKRLMDALDEYARTGKAPPGVDFREFRPEALRGAFFSRARGPGGEIQIDKLIEDLSSYFRGPLAGTSGQFQMGVLRSLLPGRGGEEERANVLRWLQRTPEERAALPEQQKAIEDFIKENRARRPEVEQYESAEQVRQFVDTLRSQTTALQSLELGKQVGEFNSSVTNFITDVQRLGIAIGNAANYVEGVIRGRKPSTGGPSGAEPEIEPHQHGGLLFGPGSETSDSIRIDASRGEFVVNAAQTRKFLPLLTAINAGKFARGGLVNGYQAGGVVDDYAKYAETHDIAKMPSRADWEAAKDAGLDPSTSFDDQGNLTADARRKIVAHRSAKAKAAPPSLGGGGGKGAASVTAAGAGAIQFSPDGSFYRDMRFPNIWLRTPEGGPPPLPPGVPPGSQISPDGKFFRNPLEPMSPWRRVPEPGVQPPPPPQTGGAQPSPPTAQPSGPGGSKTITVPQKETAQEAVEEKLEQEAIPLPRPDPRKQKGEVATKDEGGKPTVSEKKLDDAIKNLLLGEGGPKLGGKEKGLSGPGGPGELPKPSERGAPGEPPAPSEKGQPGQGEPGQEQPGQQGLRPGEGGPGQGGGPGSGASKGEGAGAPAPGAGRPGGEGEGGTLTGREGIPGPGERGGFSQSARESLAKQRRQLNEAFGNEAYRTPGTSDAEWQAIQQRSQEEVMKRSKRVAPQALMENLGENIGKARPTGMDVMVEYMNKMRWHNPAAEELRRRVPEFEERIPHGIGAPVRVPPDEMERRRQRAIAEEKAEKERFPTGRLPQGLSVEEAIKQKRFWEGKYPPMAEPTPEQRRAFEEMRDLWDQAQTGRPQVPGNFIRDNQGIFRRQGLKPYDRYEEMGPGEKSGAIKGPPPEGMQFIPTDPGLRNIEEFPKPIPPSDQPETGPVDQPREPYRPIEYQPPPPDEDQLAAGGFIGNLIRNFAGGGMVGDFINNPATVRGYAQGGGVGRIESRGGPPPSLGFHQLDLRTDFGSFAVGVTPDVLEAVWRSGLSRRLSQISQRPSWDS